MAFAIASLCSMLPWLLAEQVGLPHVDGAEGLVDGEHDGGVEDQLDAHEDPDRIAPGDHRHHAEREQRGSNDQEVRQADARHSSTMSESSLISLRAMITDP